MESWLNIIKMASINSPTYKVANITLKRPLSEIAPPMPTLPHYDISDIFVMW